MARNPLIRTKGRSFAKAMPNQSAGILDDFAIRKVINTQEGTIEKVPVDDSDIANKKYVDDNVGVGTWTDSSTNTGTNKTLDDFSNKVEADEIHIRIRNESGSTMTKGQLVYISGYNSGLDRPLVTLADASSASTMPMLAMINNGDVANNADGHATVSGRVFNINTSAFAIGDAVYVSTTPGALSTRPSGTSEQVQRIGIVLRSQANNGVIQIIGAGRTNDIPNDIDHATDLQNVGTNTHAQIDTHIGLTNEHLDWSASTVGTIHATNYVDNDTTDHTALSNIGTNSHAQIDTSITATGVNSTHVAGDGSDHADVATNTSKVSFSKTNVKATINHGGTSGTSRPTGFDSVEWIGTVEPTNAANDDTWIDTT